MKRLLVFLYLILIVCGIFGVASAGPVSYIEDGAGLVPDNEWTDGEIYTFLDGITLASGTYELSFFIEGTVWSENQNGEPYGDWESYDELYLGVYLDESLIAETSDRQGGFGAVPFTMTLDFAITDSGGPLSIRVWSDVSYIGEKWKVDEATLTGTDHQPVPEPATILFMGAGLVGLAAIRRKRNGAMS